jgi:hypothetical protein
MEAEKRKALSMYLRVAAVNGAARDTPSSTGNESATDSVGRKSSAVWDAMEPS